MKRDSSQSPVGPPHGFDAVLLCLRGMAVMPEVFLHRGFGSRYVGMQALVAVPLVLLFATAFPSQEVGGLMWFLGLYLIMCFRARMEVLRRPYRLHEHSLYSGWPRLMRVFPRRWEMVVKRFVEPALVLLVGLGLVGLSRALGAFLVLAGTALFVLVSSNEAYANARARDLRDAVIEQKQLAERFRQGSDDRY